MSQNLRLINYFISEFYSSNTFHLSHVVSPHFQFFPHTHETKLFVDYAVRMDLLRLSCRLEISSPETMDDVTFVTNFKMEIPRRNGSDLYATGINSFVVKDNLLYRVFVHYNLDNDEYTKVQRALTNGHNDLKQPDRKMDSELSFFS